MKKVILITLLFFTMHNVAAQVKKVKGQVTDMTGLPLNMANIIIKGEKKGTISDFDGYFSIDVNKGQTLVISYLGFETKEIIVQDQTEINIQLKESIVTGLNEVVVTSLGIKKSKKSLTYSTQEVKNEELTRVKDANIVNTIAGKIAGVAVTRSAGGTGGSTKVIIRGNSSIINNQPLYVVDGIPLYNVSPSQPNEVFGDTGTGNRDGGDIISLINPDDIENMSVLKGAAASALYGTQGGRGVILLTTKKGNTGKPTIKITSTSIFEQPLSLPKLQNSYLAVADNAQESWGPAGQSKEYVNNFFNTGVTQTTSVNYTGSSILGTSMLSFANTRASGILPENSLNKNNFSLKQNTKFFNDKLNISALVTYANQKIYNKPTSGLYNNPLTGLYTMNRNNDFNNYSNNYENYNAQLDIPEQNWNTTPDEFQQNPYWLIHRNKTIDKNRFLMASLSLDYTINTWLKVASRYSYSNVSNSFDKKIYATSAATLSHENGRYIFYDLVSSQNYGDLIATIDTDFNEDFSFTTNIGTSLLKNSNNKGTWLDSGITEGLASPNWFTLSNFNSIRGSRQIDAGTKEIQSVFATANVGYKDYLFLDVSGRKDWSSALVNTSSIGFFYKSVGVSNIISEVIEMPKFVNYGKIRMSYAEVGNDVSSYITVPQYTIDPVTGNPNFPNTRPLFGADYKSELKSEFEIGTEWRLFENRFGFELSYYNSKTKNQLFYIPAPLSASSASFFGINGGSIRNTGIELIADARIIENDKFSWKTILNYSHNKNTVESIPADLGNEVALTIAGNNGYQYSLVEGRPFGVIQGRTLRKDEQGRAILATDGSLQYNNTFEEIGNANPDFMLGLANNFKIGKVNVNLLIDGRFGGDVLSLTESINDFYGVSQATADARNNGGVTLQTVSATGVPATTTFTAEEYYKFVGGRNGVAGEYIYDATNVILRELSLGYTFTPKKSGLINSASLSLIGRNLFFFYKKAPFDPNLSLSTGEGLQGVDIYGIPSTRSLGLNLNVTF
jgi:TonB-linked SusC/RagA family outer membrane protein